MTEIQVGPYFLCEGDKDNLWIVHESGEGMQVSKAKFLVFIHQFYQENF